MLNKVFQISDSLLDPTIPCEHCHVLAHQIFKYSTGLLSGFLHFTNGT